MILLIECIAACIIFGAGVTISLFVNKTVWLHEYPEKVRERFLSLHPDFREKRKKEGKAGLIAGKILVLAVCILLLWLLGYLAGAKTWTEGFVNSYIIWTVVNLFDVIVLDLGIFMYWKRIRLPGTEDMDEEYSANKLQHIKEGFYGVIIGLPACLLAACIIG